MPISSATLISILVFYAVDNFLVSAYRAEKYELFNKARGQGHVDYFSVNHLSHWLSLRWFESVEELNRMRDRVFRNEARRADIEAQYKDMEKWKISPLKEALQTDNQVKDMEWLSAHLDTFLDGMEVVWAEPAHAYSPMDADASTRIIVAIDRLMKKLDPLGCWTLADKTAPESPCSPSAEWNRKTPCAFSIFGLKSNLKEHRIFIANCLGLKLCLERVVADLPDARFTNGDSDFFDMQMAGIFNQRVLYDKKLEKCFKDFEDLVAQTVNAENKGALSSLANGLIDNARKLAHTTTDVILRQTETENRLQEPRTVRIGKQTFINGPVVRQKGVEELAANLSKDELAELYNHLVVFLFNNFFPRMASDQLQFCIAEAYNCHPAKNKMKKAQEIRVVETEKKMEKKTEKMFDEKDGQQKLTVSDQRLTKMKKPRKLAYKNLRQIVPVDTYG